MGMCASHDVRSGAGVFDADELSLADARTPASGFVPRATALHQLRPEGEGCALDRFGSVHAASPGDEELALRVPRNAQPAQVSRPVDITALKGERRHVR